jgi:tetratricopeptide (TPR) repeat protein
MRFLTNENWMKQPEFIRHMMLRQEMDQARAIDAGGVFLEASQSTRQHQSDRMRHLDMEKTNQYRIRTPGADDISAGHVSSADVESLSECSLKKLIKDAINYGKCITVVATEDVFYGSSISVAVKDCEGTAVVLALYNFIPFNSKCVDAEHIVPKGSTIIVKEPYLKCFNSGHLGLRVDNPSNVNIIQHLRTLPSDCKTVEIAKRLGNKHFGEQKYNNAKLFYDEVFSPRFQPCESEMRITVLSNRAAALLKLSNFTEALVDCNAILAEDDLHRKALYRSALAHRGLRQYEIAVALFEKCLTIADSADKGFKGYVAAVQKQLAATQTMVLQSNGHYNFLKLKSPKLKVDINCIAEYIGPVEVLKAGSKGRGLFLTIDVKPHTLLFFEPALANASRNGIKESKDFVSCLNYEQNSRNDGSQHELINNLIYSASKNPQLNARLAMLSFSGASQSTSMEVPSISSIRGGRLAEVAPISALQIANVVKTNAFGGLGNFHGKESGFETGRHTTLLLVTSFMNHKSIPNTHIEHLTIGGGTFAAVFSETALKAGTELTTSYSGDADDLRSWGIGSQKQKSGGKKKKRNKKKKKK